MVGLLFICLKNAIRSYKTILEQVRRWKQTRPHGTVQRTRYLSFECRQLQFKVLFTEVVNQELQRCCFLQFALLKNKKIERSDILWSMCQPGFWNDRKKKMHYFNQTSVSNVYKEIMPTVQLDMTVLGIWRIHEKSIWKE